MHFCRRYWEGNGCPWSCVAHLLLLTWISPAALYKMLSVSRHSPRSQLHYCLDPGCVWRVNGWRQKPGNEEFNFPLSTSKHPLREICECRARSCLSCELFWSSLAVSLHSGHGTGFLVLMMEGCEQLHGFDEIQNLGAQAQGVCCSILTFNRD